MHRYQAQGEWETDNGQALLEALPVLAAILGTAQCYWPILDEHLKILLQELTIVFVPAKVERQRGDEQC